jgi:hypothetical protein
MAKAGEMELLFERRSESLAESDTSRLDLLPRAARQ